MGYSLALVATVKRRFNFLPISSALSHFSASLTSDRSVGPRAMAAQFGTLEAALKLQSVYWGCDAALLAVRRRKWSIVPSAGNTST